jgi:uncharacterized membrane protein YgaE (UPF0421/DUF939 family)
MDVNAQVDSRAHGKNSPFRWDTSTQLAVAVGLALLIAVVLHVKFNASAGVRVGK